MFWSGEPHFDLERAPGLGSTLGWIELFSGSALPLLLAVGLARSALRRGGERVHDGGGSLAPLAREA